MTAALIESTTPDVGVVEAAILAALTGLPKANLMPIPEVQDLLLDLLSTARNN